MAASTPLRLKEAILKKSIIALGIESFGANVSYNELAITETNFKLSVKSLMDDKC